MQKNKALLIALAALILTLPGVASAYVTINGTINVNHSFATYLRGADAHGDWTGAGYNYSMPSGIGFLAGNHVNDNGSWVQEAAIRAARGQRRLHLGFRIRLARRRRLPVHRPCQSGETALQEGTEFRVYGSNVLNAPVWNAATWTASWTDGHIGNQIYDDYTSRWEFNSGYRYVGIVAGNPEANFLCEDAEINAVATPVPEPASLILLGGGLLGIAAVRRRKKASN